MGNLRNHSRRQRRRNRLNNGQYFPMRPGQRSNLVSCRRKCKVLQYSHDISLLGTRQSYNRYCDFLPATTDFDAIAPSAEAEAYIDYHVQFWVFYCGCRCDSGRVLAKRGDVECDRANGWARGRWKLETPSGFLMLVMHARLKYAYILLTILGYGAFTFMWCAVEINVGIICACVPSLKPLAARLLPRLIKGSTESSSTQLGSAVRPNFPRAETAPLAVPQGQSVLANRMTPRAYTDLGPAAIPPPLNSPSREMIEMSDFLASSGPGPSEDTESSAATYPSAPLNVSTFFDFVNLKKPKSMLAMSNKESIPPLALTTILFFLWGIGYGFLDILNTQFGRITGISTWGSLGLHAAYYGGYLVSPLTIGRWILKTWGFKSTFIAGLFIYACGALIFWPSAVLTSFPPFAISNFIVGCGFGVLETAANPFISLCGPQENAEIRLNLSQAIQATGSILSAVLAEKVLFKSVTSAASLVRFQWTYLAIALFDLLLAAAFYYLPVPEATDDDLQELADRRKDDVTARVFGLPVVWVTFGLAAFSQFWYVASQEVLVFSFTDYVQAQLPNGGGGLIPFDFLLLGRGLFALGRFVTAIANLLFKPRWILLVSYIGLIAFAVLAKELHGMSGVVIGLLLFFFESGVFSITFAISLRGMGRHTKTAGAIMATSVCGGAVYPFFQEIARIHNHGSVPSSYVVLAVGYAAAAILPLYLMLVPQAKKQVDPVLNDYLHRRLTLRGQPSRRKDRNGGNENGNGRDTPPNNKGDHISLGGVLSRPRSLMDEPPSTVDFETAQSASGVSVHDLAYEHDHT